MRRLLTLITAVTALSFSAAAQEGEFRSLEIRIFRPEFSRTKIKDKQGVTITGQTEAGVKISFVEDSLKVIDVETKKESPAPSGVFDIKGLPQEAKDNGLFSFRVFLPTGKYKIGFKFEDPKDPRRTKIMILDFIQDQNQVNIIFDENSVFEPDRPKTEDDKKQVVLTEITNYYAFGVGMNYLLYTKENADLPMDANFGSFQIPSLRGEYRRTFNENWAFSGSLLLAPGETKSGQRIDIESGKYIWTILELEARYTKPEWTYRYSDTGEIRYGILGGLDYHILPYLKTAQAGDTKQTMDSNSIADVAFGGYANLLTSETWEFQSYVKLQYPVMAGSKFDIESQFSFSGSLGVVHKPTDSKWAYGTYWYGQWVSGSIKEQDAYTQTEVSSKTGLLYSNIEFRWFYRY